MFGWLKKIFEKKTTPEAVSRQPQLWKINQDDFKWYDFDTRRIVGWRISKPSAGDFLKAKMQSGKIAYFKFEKVEPCSDPTDMFFADVSDYGYEGEVELPKFYTPEFRFL